MSRAWMIIKLFVVFFTKIFIFKTNYNFFAGWFVIFEITYHSLDDFTYRGARSLFSQVLDLTKQLEEINRELKEKRDLYSNGGAAVSSLSSSILELEKKSEIMHRQIERLRDEARNEEIRNLIK